MHYWFAYLQFIDIIGKIPVFRQPFGLPKIGVMRQVEEKGEVWVQ